MPTRVLHVLPHRGGGGESYIDLLEPMPGFAHRRFYLSSGRTPVSGLSSIPLRWPRLVAQAMKADLIHCHGDVASAFSLPLMRVRPAVMTCQGLHMTRRAHGPGRLIMIRALRSIAASARAVICSSTAEREELVPIVRPRDHRKLLLIHNGVDVPDESRLPDYTAAREQLGLAAGDVAGLFVGHLEERKAPLLAAAAARRVQAEGLPFVLLFAGDGPMADELKAHPDPSIRLLGHQDDMPRLYAAADVFVQPSEREGMSFALLEAMAYGLPPVAADGPGNPEAVGDAGMMFPAGDELALAGALIELIGTRELRDRLGRAARARVIERFAADRFRRDSAAVYADALGTSGRR